jgi:peptide deformylase
MSVRRILQLGDPLLRSVSAAIPQPCTTDAVLRDLRDTLRDFRRARGFGRGISAVQIGIPVRVVYIEFEGSAYSLINPEFLSPICWSGWSDRIRCGSDITTSMAPCGNWRPQAHFQN